MKSFKCKLLKIDNPPVYHLSYDELASMSIQYPMALEVNGEWKSIVHSNNKIYTV